MPIVNTNFIAGKMNKSVDERLVPPGQYINAINYIQFISSFVGFLFESLIISNI